MAGRDSGSVLCKQLLAFTAFALILVDLQCQCAQIAEATASPAIGETTTLQVENGPAWRNSKLRAANFGQAPAVGVTYRKSTMNLLRRITRARVTSYEGLNSSSTSRLEVEALIAFKAAVTSDPLGALKSWHANDSDACGWDGVVCTPQQPKHLIALNLSGGQLVGNLNSALREVGNLPFLQRLDLSANVFNGSIPAASLANCSRLSYLDFSVNELTGGIPSEIGDIVKLQTLNLGQNNLTGDIPASLGNCTLLTLLDLGQNSLTGDIPPLLGELSSLELLNLSTNALSGSIPPALAPNGSSLTYLDLSYNSNLQGELPPQLTQLKRLQVLNLGHCSFWGALPAWLGANLTALSELYMTENQFYGEIPDTLGQLRALTVLYLGKNNLTGIIPISIVTNCTLLAEFRADSNSLTGEFPPQLGSLKNLEILDLSTNSFTGVIPPSLLNCSALFYLLLGYNPLLDPHVIPSWIGSLPSLNEIYFPGMNLQGNIPAEIGKLSNLQFFFLASNNLSGPLPGSTLANCTLLVNLELLNNKFTGEIPPELGTLQNLILLDAGTNFFTGPFPSFLANLTQIEAFAVDTNLLNGTIDGDFGGLYQLLELYGEDNSLTGPFPESLSNCSQLYYVDLSQNSLTGEIPPSLKNATNLEELVLAHNMMQGSIPFLSNTLGDLDLQGNNFGGDLSNIGLLSSLQSLKLNNNLFTGAVPASLGNCSGMLLLDLSYNKFSGTIPGDVISEMSLSLNFLNLSHNLFSGPCPPQLSKLVSVQILDVSANNISGSIPASLGSCVALVRLDISINNLTGEIPESLGLLPSLEFFNASFNDFQGPIPDSGVFKSNLTKASFLGNPGLCGIILGPDDECSSTAPAGNTSKSCHGFKCKQVWIPTTCALVVVVLILAVVIISWVNFSGYGVRKGYTTVMLNFETHDQMRFSEKDVLRAIGGDGENVIGTGGKSVVYKGVLFGGEMFAVKILPGYSEHNEELGGIHRENELMREVQTLANLRHRNILKVLSFYSTMDLKAIVLEYMPEGSLHRHLYEIPEDECGLTWQIRLGIAIGVAEAMTYLHHDFPEPLIHRDLKPGNILLDANFNPKVADFGLSKFANPGSDGDVTASSLDGTIGYMPPEYASETRISTKGDVYSYGMVLLEMLTRRPPTSFDNLGRNGDLISWVMEAFEERPFDVLDSTLKHECNVDKHRKEQMLLLMRVALFCTRDASQIRPSMKDVVMMLTQIKEVGVESIAPKSLEDLANDTNDGTMWTNQHPSDARLPSI